MQEEGASPRGGLTKASNAKYYGFGQISMWNGDIFEFDPAANEISQKTEIQFHPDNQYNSFTLNNRPIEVILSVGCPGDLDGSGQIGGGDLLLLLADFGCTTEECIDSDVNNDSLVNTSDLFVIISSSGTYCP